MPLPSLHQDTPAMGNTQLGGPGGGSGEAAVTWGCGDMGLQWLRYSRWMSMVTEVSFPLGMALLVARQTMLSPFSMSEGAMKRVLMMLSLLPSRRSVCEGR